MKVLEEKRELLAKYSNLAYSKELCMGGEGNISLRLNQNEILITPSGYSLSEISPNDGVIVTMNGEKKEFEAKQPSSETKMHLEIYKQRSDVNAIVHTHSRNVLIYALCNEKLPWETHPEIVAFIGEIPMIPYGRPSTSELAKTVADYLQPGIYAGLMANHGAVTIGSDLRSAFWRSEVLDTFAYACCFSHLVGTPVRIPSKDIEEIKVK